MFGAIFGTLVGILVAGALRKMFPVLDVTAVLAGVVAAGCIVGVVLEWRREFGPKSKRPRD
jgi:ribose/xylose/arabinose/galactoside ABC-type transport system permease subunit